MTSGRRKTHAEYVESVAQLGGGISVIGTYAGMRVPIDHLCNHCGYEWPARPYAILANKGCPDCKGRNIDYPERLKQDGRGFVITEPYVNQTTAINHRCLKGHEWPAMPYTVTKNGNGCPHCSGRIPPLNYEEWLKQDGRGYEALEPYVNGTTSIKHRCSKGHEFDATPASVKSGLRCLDCAALTPKGYDEWLEKDDRGIIALQPFNGNRENIKHRCLKGHEWPATPHNIKKGTGCPDCAIKKRSEKRKFTNAEYVKQVAEINSDISVIGTYVSNQIPITHGCLSCGHKWEAQPNNIKNGTGCPDCALEGTDANVFYIWQNGDSDIYKVGITSERCAEDRIAICTRNNGMTANIVLTLNAKNARDIEREALTMGTAADYPSTIDGYTEFRYFTEAQLNDVCQMANEMSQGEHHETNR